MTANERLAEIEDELRRLSGEIEKANKLRDALREALRCEEDAERILTGPVEMPVLRILANCGIEWLFVDMEHGSLDVSELLNLVQMADALGRPLESGGMFTVTSYGYGSMRISIPQALVGYSQFDVTVEPSEGSPQPTGTKVLQTRI